MISLPDYDIFQSEPIVKALVSGYGKEYRGHTTLKRDKDTKQGQASGLDAME